MATLRRADNYMINCGISTATLYPMLTEKSLLTLAEQGVKCAEIFFNSDCELEKGFVNELKKIKDSYNMKICSIHPYTCGIEPMMFFTQYPRRFFDILEYYKKYFEIMNILGADVFVFHGNKPQNAFSDEMYFERYKGLYDLGKSFGITVAQENVCRCSSRSLDFLVKMSDTLGDDAHFVLDTKQAVRSGISPYDIIDRLGNKICHVHISDHNADKDCTLVGKGNLNMNRFAHSLKDCSYTGSIILELYSDGYGNVSELKQNLDYFEEIVKNVWTNTQTFSTNR